MLNKIKKTALHLTRHSLIIHYRTNKTELSFEILKNGWCDLNDLDEFCEASIPGYIIGCRNIDQMVDLAARIYRHYMQKNKMQLQSPLNKQVAKNKMRSLNLQRHIGV